MKAKVVWIALASCLLTLGAVFLMLNLSSGEKKIERQLERLYATDEPQFRRAMGALLGPPILEGNKTEVLVNGDAIFAAILKAIGQARRTITFETYIYWSETIGREFAEALIERARAGVKVHVLLDWLGSAKMEAHYLDDMKAAGVQVERYHEPHWSNLQRINTRQCESMLALQHLREQRQRSFQTRQLAAIRRSAQQDSDDAAPRDGPCTTPAMHREIDVPGDFRAVRAGGQELAPCGAAPQRLREAGRRYQSAEFRIGQKQQQFFHAQARGEGTCCTGARAAFAQCCNEIKRAGIGHARHSGSTHTTAVQLWKPPNCPSARAICP
jgi:hypothetical protein